MRGAPAATSARLAGRQSKSRAGAEAAGAFDGCAPLTLCHPIPMALAPMDSHLA